MKTVKIIWNTVTWLIVILAVLLAIALVGVRAFQIQPYIVLSGSMEPEYKAGSVIYLKEVPDKSVIKVGDPITYKVEGIEEACTHRVIEIKPNTDPENQHLGKFVFHTKGDANETADGAVVYSENVIGLPIYHIPYLGYVADFVKQPKGRMTIISAVCIVLLCMIIPSFFTVEEDAAKKDEEEAPQDSPENSGDGEDPKPDEPQPVTEEQPAQETEE